MTNNHADKGKYAESVVSAWLDHRASIELGFAFHRYPDAKAARGALAAQPADFLVGRKVAGRENEACHLEVKETKEIKRLPRGKIGQYGKLKMFDEAGFRTIVLVFRSELGDWTYLRRRELFNHEHCPTSFPFEGRPCFPTAAAALQEIFP